MKLVLDKDSFETPYLSAFEQTEAALVNAGRTVAGASTRAEAAANDLVDLRSFKSSLTNHLRAGTLSKLPYVRAPFRRITHCHHLTVGPWKGIFLIDPGKDLAVGLVFSKAPHHFIERVRELIEYHTDETPRDEGT